MNNETSPQPSQHQMAEEQVESSVPYLSIAQAVGLVILMVVLQLFISMALSKTGGPLGDEADWRNISFTHALSGLLTAKAGAILAGLSLGALLAVGFKPQLLFPLLSCTIGISILSSELSNLLQRISPISDLYVEMLKKLFQQNLVGVLIAVGVVAPVVEELIFRGVILEGLIVRYRTVKAVFISSLLFGLIHIFPWVIINAFLLGLFFSWLKLRTQSLMLCIIAHSLYNSLPFLLTGTMSVVIPGYNSPPSETVVHFQPIWFDLVGLALVVGGMWGIHAIVAEDAEEVDHWAPSIS